jgi:hypothetical protein
MSRRFSAFLLVVLPVLPLCAQQFGAITGTVTDATGASIAGAAVVATNIATGQARNAASNEIGVYAFPYLVPGSYTVLKSSV